MKLIFTLALTLSCLAFSLSAGEKTTCYELRTYHANKGKLDQLHARFRDHTVSLFEKHGMTNLIYWVPVENDDNLLIYLLSYPSKDARDSSWKRFREDPEWTTVYKASTQNGKLVSKVESHFLTEVDYSPIKSLPQPEAAPLYEMRQYTTNERKLDDLDARFRDHTIGLFTKHGITNLYYFHPSEGEEGSKNTLLYFISAPSEKARNSSFQAFGQDPAWKKAREESEKEGRILVKKGVKSTFLKTTDYSPVK